MTKKKTPSKREAKKVAMRLHIIKAAMKLFTKQGFDNTTMEAIAENADVTKRTLYSYFPIKEAIVSAHWINTTEKNTKRIPLLFKLYRSTHSRLTKICLSGVQRIKAEQEYARITFSFQLRQLGNSADSQSESAFVQVLISVLEAGQAQGDIRTDIPANELALQIRQHFTAICFMWLANPDAFSLDEHITNAVECFINGAGSPKA
ncbi:MAG TPA: TetR/AcrR family transcriptional regulator [Mariprofundaceae bacterium]|nr:TetR/AcrR family transcriptional regulator [Mariprofundaceae bacterium]